MFESLTKPVCLPHIGRAHNNKRFSTFHYQHYTRNPSNAAVSIGAGRNTEFCLQRIFPLFLLHYRCRTTTRLIPHDCASRWNDLTYFKQLQLFTNTDTNFYLTLAVGL